MLQFLSPGGVKTLSLVPNTFFKLQIFLYTMLAPKIFLQTVLQTIHFLLQTIVFPQTFPLKLAPAWLDTVATS